jgi:hypothetical protein
MKHLETDQIVALIENKLNEVDCKDAEEHISRCDLCFTYYASYKSSNLEIENAEIEKTPHDIFIKLLSKNQTSTEKRETSKSKLPFINFKNQYSENFTGFTSKLTSIFVPLSFVVILTFMVYNDYTSDPSIPMASQDKEVEWLEQEEVSTMVSTDMTRPENNENEGFGIADADGAEMKNQNEKYIYLSPSQNIISRKILDNYPINILAYFEPEKNKIITRSISRSYVVPNLSGMQFDEIEKILQIESVRYIIYSHHEFKQIPEPGKFLYQEDTLKIYINNK